MPQIPFSVTAGGDDGNVVKAHASYPPTAAVAVADLASTDCFADREFTSGDAQYRVYNGLIRFDTSSLPDTATVTNAVLRVYITFVTNPDGYSFCAEWFSGAFDATAWTNTVVSDAISPISVSDLAVGSRDFTLSNPTNVSLTGYTGLRFHFSPAATTPTAQNYVGMASLEHATQAEPQLIVDYTTSAPVRLAPDAIISQTNLTGSVSAIQDDPDSADSTWLLAP